MPSKILASLPSPPPSQPSTPATTPQARPTPLTYLFDAFWKALDGRALAFSSLQRSATSAAFLASLFECMVFLIKRVLGDKRVHGVLVLESGKPGPEPSEPRRLAEAEENHRDQDAVTEDVVEERVRGFVRAQVGSVWEASVAKTLRVEQRAAARLVGQMLMSLNEVDTSTSSHSLEGSCLAVLNLLI